MEDHETRLKRLYIRSWRRGTKEMDLILGGFARDEMTKLSKDDLDAHEEMMAEHDHDLYHWISGQSEFPKEIAPALQRVRDYFLKTR